jgi:hypothetical protein
MDFRGPEAADFANVKALNRAFLRLLRDTAAGRRMRQQLAAPIQELIRGLTDLQINRLSAAPFLLLSLRERDDRYWNVLISDEANADLFVTTPDDVDTSQLDTAGVAFLWQLARRNPYAARLVSGGTLVWCEQLANCTLLRLLQRTSNCLDLLQPRLPNKVDFWKKLLGPGLSSEQNVCAAAHMAALQTILTDDPAPQYRPLRAAACNSIVPSRQVADKSQR